MFSRDNWRRRTGQTPERSSELWIPLVPGYVCSHTHPSLTHTPHTCTQGYVCLHSPPSHTFTPHTHTHTHTHTYSLTLTQLPFSLPLPSLLCWYVYVHVDPRVVQCIRKQPQIKKLVYVACNPEGHTTIGNFVE